MSGAEKGADGGLRIIYYLLSRYDQVWLFTLFGKDEAADLTASEKRQLRVAIQVELRARDNAARHKHRRG
jgi:hypothetical protein